MISFDSNVLVYAADYTAGDRQERAADLVERAMRAQNCTQALQSLCEFFAVVTRKLGVDRIAATELVATWSDAMVVEAPTLQDLSDAMRAVREHGLPFWDAMLWATVRRAGVRLLITEDFQDGRILEGVRFANPFAAHNTALIDREFSG